MRRDRQLLATRHGRMHVRTAGDPGGRQTPLVLLHMAPQSSRMFDRVAPLLASDRYVVMPDRIGFGDSDHAPEPLPFPEYALATLDALDQLGLERFDVVGAHTGSCETVELATAHASRVRRAGILAVPALTDEEIARFKAGYVPPPEPRPDGSHLTWYWDWWLRWLKPEWGLDLAHTRVLDMLKASPEYWQAYHSVFDYPLGERLPLIEQPFLVLAPHDDLWELTERNLGLCPPQTTVVELPHLTIEGFMLAPDELARHIREHLS